MIRPFQIAFFVTTCFLVVPSSTTVAQESSNPVVPPPAPALAADPLLTRWEYLVVSERILLQEIRDLRQKDPASQASLSTVLSARGHDGWEMITAIAKPSSYDESNDKIYTEVEYLFKRPTR